MKKVFTFYAILCIFSLMSCTDREDDTLATPPDNATTEADAIDYIIFGWFYGECIGETCIEIFKIDSDEILEDFNDNYPSTDDFCDTSFGFNFPWPTNSQAYIAVIDSFPIALLDETENVLGTPDAADGGGMYLEFKNGDYRNFWLLDQDKNNVPTYLHDYMNLVNVKIALLSDQ